MKKKIEKYVLQAENFTSEIQVKRWQERVATFLRNSLPPKESENFNALQLGFNDWDDLSRQLGFLEALCGQLESNKITKTTDRVSIVKNIITELEDFKADVSFYYKNAFDTYGEDTAAVREKITKNSIKIKGYLKDVNVPTTMAGRAAPVAGGFPFSFDLIEDMFQNEGGPYAVQPKIVIDTLNKAIGIYEQAKESGHLPNDTTKSINNSLREGFFIDGQYYEAQKFIRDLFKKSKKSIKIIDNFINSNVIDLLTVKSKNVVIEIISRKIEADVKPMSESFNKQYGELALRTSKAFHDRFIIIDNTQYYHLGASIKDLGHRTFMFSLMEEPEMINSLKEKWIREWDSGNIVI
ncbi:MAG: hypothetical protein JRC90_02870 [Deltaproteobacteria bacterium]|nr:hypothetical protein [Deltaproteobacteria bacterium]